MPLAQPQLGMRDRAFRTHSAAPRLYMALQTRCGGEKRAGQVDRISAQSISSQALPTPRSRSHAHGGVGESFGAGFEWDVVGDGRIWSFPQEAANHHQTWLREPTAGRYRLDVFREPHVGDRWVCRRDASITLPYDELILHTGEGIPYVIPEVALLFKAKGLREKDEADFQRVLTAVDQSRRSRLSEWLSQVHPGHPWLERI
jgi:hypothetical protein